MALSALLTVVGSTGGTPKQFTLASPCDSVYQMTSTIINYGNFTDTTPPQNAAGIVANGYVNVQYHENNQWKTGTLLTSQTGAQINTLVVA